MERENKTGVELKQLDEAGTGLARIATLDVIDADGDLTVKGAFGEQHVQVLPTHNWGSVPLGKARVFEKGNEALAEFRLNLETVVGKEWHAALMFDLHDGKPIQAWSYGFTVDEASFEERDGVGRVRILERLTVHEVSPVVVGSGVGTETLAIKSAAGKRATPSHSTATSTDAWDGPGNKRRARTDEDAAYYRRIFAWRDPTGETGVKGSWRFIHHFVAGDGAPGNASTRACIMGIAILNGARGGTTILSADRQGVWNHLAKHLRDADLDPPELRSAEEGGVKLMEQVTFALWDVDAVVERLLQVKRERMDRGRFLGEESTLGAAELKATLEKMHETAFALEALIREGDGASEAGRLLASFEAVRSGFGRHLGGCCKVDGVRIKGRRLAALLRRLRDEQELSNEDLAGAAGVAEGTMSQILGGTINCPPLRRLSGLARRLGVSAGSLRSAAESDGCDYG